MNQELTKRQRFVLAALAVQSGTALAPVQVQKLFFLFDENIANKIGGKQFDFEPYDYGPFDKDVYAEFGALNAMGLARVLENVDSPAKRLYLLTSEGQAAGEEALTNYDEGTREYMGEVSSWVSRLSFGELVGAVYKSYPEMRVNSVFVG